MIAVQRTHTGVVLEIESPEGDGHSINLEPAIAAYIAGALAHAAGVKFG